MFGLAKQFVPTDFHKIMGDKLPTSLYYLMAQGLMS